MDSDDAIGLSLALCSVVLTNIALLIQKHSANVEKGRPLHKRWRFIFGFLLNTGSEIGLSAPASLFAPLALLAPLGGVAVVVNALLTRFGCVCGIKEKLSYLEWLATLCVMGGVALVAFSGPGGDTDIVLDDLPVQFSQPAFLGFLIPGMCLVCYTMWLFPPCSCAQSKLARRWRPKEGTPGRTALSGFTAATCGAFSVLSLKIALFTIIEWINKRIAYPPPLSILCFTVLLTCAPLQLYLLNLSLAAGKATFSIPLYLSLLMLFISFMGGILFYEFGSLLRDPYPLYLVLYISGCGMVLLGLAILSYKQQFRDGAVAVAPETEAAQGATEMRVTTTPSTLERDSMAKTRTSIVTVNGLSLSERDSLPSPSSPAETSFAVAQPRGQPVLETNGYLCTGGGAALSAVPWSGNNVGGESRGARLSLRPLLQMSPQARRPSSKLPPSGLGPNSAASIVAPAAQAHGGPGKPPKKVSLPSTPPHR